MPGEDKSAGARNSILILGGGASGVILAAHLLRSPDANLRVTIIERRPDFGRGHAYSTPLADHVLNVRARGMSAFGEDPDHFWKWTKSQGHGDDPDQFAPRGLYGQYLGSILEALAHDDPERLHLVHGEIESITPLASGVSVAMADGSNVVGRKAVLALGHGDSELSPLSHAVRFGAPDDTPLDPTRDVLALGTGLSMVDTWLGLQHRGHRARLIAVSRRGLLPLPHRQGNPIRLDSSDVPLGTDLSYFMRWFHDLVRHARESGGTWRDAVDGLRPFNQRIWRSWSTSARRRFLEHTKAWWDIHRHRMPPDIHSRISEEVKAGRILLVAGRLGDVEQTEDGGYAVSLRLRIPQSDMSCDVARIYDCTGIVRSVAEGSNAPLRFLLDRGYARSDAFGIGLDVTPDCAVIDANGAASTRLYAVGPLTRGEFFEIDAIPDIRTQCAELARRLSARGAA